MEGVRGSSPLSSTHLTCGLSNPKVAYTHRVPNLPLACLLVRTPSAYKTSNGATTYKVRYRLRGRQSSATFERKPEATRFCQLLDSVGPERALAYLDEAESTEGVHAALTLDAWAERYLASLTSVTPGTRATYARVYQRAWHPALGHLPLRSITREQVAAQLNAYAATRSDKTVKNASGLLSAMLSTAVLDGHLAANPTKGLRLPRRTSHQKVPKRFLTPAEFQRLLAEIPAHYQPLVTVLAASGCRWSEAEALQVADVNLSASTATLRINKAIKWDTSASVRGVGPTKTRKSDRTITLPARAVEALRPLVTGRASSARLFNGPQGGPLRHHLFYRSWRSACRRAGLEPAPRIHDLRHSHVAWLIAGGTPLPVIQARLGHESIVTTVDTYGGLLPDLQLAAAEAAAMAFVVEPPALVAV
jgi:integrase